VTDINRKTVLITGAGHGIGKIMAERIAALGAAKLIIFDINKDNLDNAAKELREMGPEVYPKVCDISDREAVYRCADEVHKEAGQVDILINNAGVVFTGEILDLPDDRHKKQVDVNLLGTLWMLKAFVPDMVDRNEGHIVNIASSAGMLAVPGMGIYCATKFALMGLTEALRGELLNHDSSVKVTVVCPYAIDTGMFNGFKPLPLMPILKPEVMAQAVVEGILKDRKIVAKPLTVYMLPLVKALVPPSVVDRIVRLLGLNRSAYSCLDFYKRRAE